MYQYDKYELEEELEMLEADLQSEEELLNYKRLELNNILQGVGYLQKRIAEIKDTLAGNNYQQVACAQPAMMACEQPVFREEIKVPTIDLQNIGDGVIFKRPCSGAPDNEIYESKEPLFFADGTKSDIVLCKLKAMPFPSKQ